MFGVIGVLYRRRAAAPEMTLVFTSLNIGLFAAVSSIGSGSFPTGIGFGLFGLLSLVRLLVNGLPERNLVLVLGLDVVLLAAIWVTDESRSVSPTRVMRLSWPSTTRPSGRPAARASAGSGRSTTC